MKTAIPGEWVDTGLGLADIDFDQYSMQVSTDRYTSLQIAEREREAIWSRVWQGAGRADELPDVGDWIEYRLLDQSYVIVRGHDGELRGFVNVCRHRGNKLCTGGRGNCGSAARFVCPYHLWSYDFEGRLLRVSRPDLVGPIDKSEHGLLPISVETFAGFVFVNPDPDAAPLAAFLGEAGELLAPYHLEEMVPVLNVRESVDCNWKVVVDAFAEGYHVEAIHPELLRVLTIDSEQERFGFFGDHFVVAVPFEVANVAGFGPEQQVEGIRELPGTFPGVAAVLPRFDALIDEYRDGTGALQLPDGVTPRTVLQRATRETWTARGLDVSGLTDAADQRQPRVAAVPELLRDHPRRRGDDHPHPPTPERRPEPVPLARTRLHVVAAGGARRGHVSRSLMSRTRGAISTSSRCNRTTSRCPANRPACATAASTISCREARGAHRALPSVG